MRVLFLTQFYPPESGAPQNRLSDLARRLAGLGHDVEVLTAMPNYPRGEVFDEYRKKKIVRETRDGVPVVRTWIWAQPGKGFVRRLGTYLSFMVSSVLLGLPKVRRPDAIFVELPPLFLGLSGYLISRLRRARLVVNVSDLWPESAVAMGVLKNRTLIRASTRLEEFLYRRADLITGQTAGIVNNIRRRFPEKNVSLVTNGVDMARFAPSSMSESQSVRREFGVEGKFVVGYAGLHGYAQGLESLVAAARLLAANPEIAFAMVGDGPVKSDLIAASEGLRNVVFVDAQPASRMRAVLSAFDAAVIPLRKLDVFQGALPSKMFEAMAAGLPVVLGVEGEAKSLVQSAGAGICIEPENPRALAEVILFLQKHPAARLQMGHAGRAHVAAHYNREMIAAEFDRTLRAMEGDQPSPCPTTGSEEVTSAVCAAADKQR